MPKLVQLGLHLFPETESYVNLFQMLVPDEKWSVEKNVLSQSWP